MRILFIWANKDQFGFKPISISLLSAILKRDGHKVDLFDTTFIDLGFKDNTQVRSKLKIFKAIDLSGYDLSKKKLSVRKELLQKLNKFKPDVVAFSVLSDEIYLAFNMSKITKEWDADTVVLWGNKAATMVPEKVLDCKDIDYICIGEGIEFITEIINSISNNKNLKNIDNIAYKDNMGKVHKNKLRPYFQNLDSLPFLDWTIFDKRHFLKPYDGEIYTGGDHMIYWGCPNECTYCINHAYRKLYGKDSGRFIRHYSVDRIINELEYLVSKWNINFFKFHDESFCIKPMRYFYELTEKYHKRINVPFTIMVNAKNVTQEKVNLLKKMNCVSMTIGIETGNERLRRNVLKRKDTVDDIIKTVDLFNKAGIRTSSFNMLGIPFENRDTIMETIELNKRAEVLYPNSGFFFPLEGTELRKVAIDNGFFDKTSKDTFQNDYSVLSFKEITKEELISVRERFVLYIKMPYLFYDFIKRSEKEDAVGKKLTKELYKIYDECILSNNNVWCGNENIDQFTRRLKNIMH